MNSAAILPTVLIAIGSAAVLSILAFWIWMLVDCLTREPREGNDRLIWTLVIVFTKLFGAGLYYFMRYRRRRSLTPVRA